MQRKIILHTFTDTGYNGQRKLSTTRNILVAKPPDPIEVAIKNEHNEILYSAINTLTTNEANVIRLRFLSQEHVGYRPIAKRLDCSHEQVRKLVSSGLEKLQFLLSGLNELGMLGNRPFTGSISEASPPLRPGRETYRQAQKLNLTPEERKERERQHKRDHYERNKDRIKKEHREFYEENKNYWHFVCMGWKERNKEAHATYQKQYHKVYAPRYNKKQIEQLADGYIESVIVRNSCLSAKDIPQELIELKRQQLKLTRLIKLKEKEQSDEHSANQNSG